VFFAVPFFAEVLFAGARPAGVRRRAPPARPPRAPFPAFATPPGYSVRSRHRPRDGLGERLSVRGRPSRTRAEALSSCTPPTVSYEEPLRARENSDRSSRGVARSHDGQAASQRPFRSVAIVRPAA